MNTRTIFVLVLLCLASISGSADVSCPEYAYRLCSQWWEYNGSFNIYSSSEFPWASSTTLCTWDDCKHFYLYKDIGFDFLFNSQRRNNTKMEVFGFKTSTYKPFSDQVVDYWSVDPILKKPCATARLRIDIPKNSVWGGEEKYDKASFTGCGDYRLQDQTVADSSQYPNSGRVSYAPDSIYDGGVEKWRQTDYSQSYSNVPNSTIRQYGCFMTSVCNALAEIGIYIDPPTMNAYLKSEPDGFAGRNVNGQAVARIAKKRFGVPLKYLRGVLSVNEALTRNIPTITSVHDTGHWVAVYGKSVRADKNIKTRILDPNRNRDIQHLEDYSGYSTSNTRSFYKMISPAPTKSNLSQQFALDSNISTLSASATPVDACSLSLEQEDNPSPDYLSSSVTAMSDDASIQLSLTSPYGSAVSENEQLENQETGRSSGPGANCGDC